MSKKENKNVVGEYLVEQIRKLERDLDRSYDAQAYLADQQVKLQKQVDKFEELKKLFTLEDSGDVKAIIMHDFNGGYQTMVAIETSEDFNKWVELLELKENK